MRLGFNYGVMVALYLFVRLRTVTMKRNKISSGNLNDSKISPFNDK